MSSPILEADIIQIVNYDEEKFANWFVRDALIYSPTVGPKPPDLRTSAH